MKNANTLLLVLAVVGLMFYTATLWRDVHAASNTQDMLNTTRLETNMKVSIPIDGLIDCYTDANLGDVCLVQITENFDF